MYMYIQEELVKRGGRACNTGAEFVYLFVLLSKTCTISVFIIDIKVTADLY